MNNYGNLIIKLKNIRDEIDDIDMDITADDCSAKGQHKGVFLVSKEQAKKMTDIGQFVPFDGEGVVF